MKKQVIKDYPDYYVCEDGNVYSTRFTPPKVLKGGLDTKGYKQVCLTKVVNGKKIQTTRKVHRLVAEAFLPNPKNLPQVNHIDEDKTNSKLSNLEWMTCQQNVEYSQAHKYILTHKDGPIVKVDNINTFTEEFLKKSRASATNFRKLLRGEAKSCYGYIKIERIYE